MQDVVMRRKFIDNEGGDAKQIKLQQQRLRALVNFAEANACRRQILLKYFGEATEPCNNCDICLGYGSMDQSAAPIPKRDMRRERNAQFMQGMDASGEALLVRLKALRMKLAKSRGVAAYVIFSDKSLIDMATRKPLTKWDFGEVHGVGDAKQEQFGTIFLAEIAGFVKQKAA
jgi:superfamily II DNA helicase RecQ